MGSCSLIPGRGCFGDLPGDETVESPPSLIVEPLVRELDATIAQAQARAAKSAQKSVAAQEERSNVSVDLTV